MLAGSSAMGRDYGALTLAGGVRWAAAENRLRGVRESQNRIVLNSETMFQALCHTSPHPHPRKPGFQPQRSPPACWYHLTGSLQALGLSFPTGAAQNTMERLGTRETVWVKLETPCPNSPPS